MTRGVNPQPAGGTPAHCNEPQTTSSRRARLAEHHHRKAELTLKITLTTPIGARPMQYLTGLTSLSFFGVRAPIFRSFA